MVFIKIAEAIHKVIDKTSWIFISVGMAVLGALMLLTTVDVVGRYVFDMPVRGGFDLSEYMMAVAVSSTLAYCGVKKGHVRVELVISHFPERVQAILNTVTGLCGMFLFAVMTWQGFVNMIMLYESGVKSTVLLIPRYPFAGFLALGCLLLVIVLLADLLEFLGQAVKR